MGTHWHQNRFYKKAAAFVLRAVAKHSPQLAQAVVDCGALDALVVCLEEFDPGVKEAAAWALGYIARHNTQLAQAVVDSGAIPLLVLCIQEPELALKRIAASAHLAQMILNPDAKLRRQILSALAQISKHSVELAELVVEAEVFPGVLTCLKSDDAYVVKNTATLMREIAKHTPELAQLIVNAGGVAAIVDMLSSSPHKQGSVRLSAIMMLGYVAAHAEKLAMAVIVSRAVNQLAIALAEEKEDHVKAAAEWSLGQVGRHSPEHSKAVAVANVVPKLLYLYLNENSSDDLQLKSKKSLKNILQKCTPLPALEPLLHDAPPDILKHVIAQYSKVLPHDAKARRLFTTSGGLKKVQEMTAEEGGELSQHIAAVRRGFPDEILKYYSPNYNEQLLETLESFNPNQEQGDLSNASKQENEPQADE